MQHEKYLLHSLSAIYMRDITHSKHFSHYPGRGHHCRCPILLHHIHLSFAHGWSVAQPHLITLITPRGARTAPSCTVTGSNDFDASSFSHSYAIGTSSISGFFLIFLSTPTLVNAPPYILLECLGCLRDAFKL